jgi:tRNA(Ile2) C34 agmatinyltransferase TiaS
MTILRYKKRVPVQKYQYGQGPYMTVLVTRHLRPSSRKTTVCHGCGDVFKPKFRDNVRCEKCSRMQRVLMHQKFKARKVRGFNNHTCADCRWALRRGLKTERER